MERKSLNIRSRIRLIILHTSSQQKHVNKALKKAESVCFQSLSSGFHPCMLILSLRSSLQSQVAVCQKLVEKREEKRADYKKGIRREKNDKREKGRRGLLCPLV